MPKPAGSFEFDTRWLFRGYSFVGGAFGAFLLVIGPLWAGASLARVFGAILIGVACIAFPLGQAEDSSLRGKVCLCFAVAHGLPAVVLAFQHQMFGSPSRIYRPADLLMYVTFLFICGYRQGDGRLMTPRMQTIFEEPEREYSQQLRSQYEEQIRLAASREERHRLARDLHDSVKQQLFVIQTAAATAQARYSVDETGAREALDHVRAASREALTEMQAMLDQLQAAPLEPSGLVAALKRQCEALGFRTGAHVHLEIGTVPDVNSYSPGLPDAIFRAAQEALSNVARHSRARNVWFRLGTVGATFELVIRDDGSGFDTAHAQNGMGLDNMKTRAKEFGGTFEVLSAPGAGTTTTFRFPVRESERPQNHGRMLLLFGSTLAVALAVMIFKKSLMQSWVAAPILYQFAVHLTGYLEQRRMRSRA